MDNEASFEYTYSAPDREEVKRIRDKYLPPDERETKLERLRRLDAGVTRKGTVCALTLGIISSLVLGVGMCCCMVWTELFVYGIVIGLVGILGIALAYPLYKNITKKERKRVTPEILKLTEELLQ